MVLLGDKPSPCPTPSCKPPGTPWLGCSVAGSVCTCCPSVAPTWQGPRCRGCRFLSVTPVRFQGGLELTPSNTLYLRLDLSTADHTAARYLGGRQPMQPTTPPLLSAVQPGLGDASPPPAIHLPLIRPLSHPSPASVQGAAWPQGMCELWEVAGSLAVAILTSRGFLLHDPLIGLCW